MRVRGEAGHEEGGGGAARLQDVEDLRGEAGIGPVVEAEDDLAGAGADLVDLPGLRQGQVRLADDEPGRRVEVELPAAGLRRRADPPDVAVPVEDEVVAGRDLREPGEVERLRAVLAPERPQRGVLGAEPPERRPLDPRRVRRADLVERRHRVGQPDLVGASLLVPVGEVGVERLRVELDRGLGVGRDHRRLLEARGGRGGRGVAAARLRPVVGVSRDRHDQLLARDERRRRLQVPDEPVLGGDGPRRRREPVLVVVHENDGVGVAADALVVVGRVGRRQRHEELRVLAVEGPGELGDEAGEVLLVTLGHLLEVEHHAGTVRPGHVGHELGDRLRAGLRARQHLPELGGEPPRSVAVVDEGHDLEVRAGRAQPLVEPRVRLHDHPPVGRDDVQGLRHQQVDLRVVLAQGREARGVPRNVERGAQRLAGGLRGAGGQHAPQAAGSLLDGCGPGALPHGVEGGPGLGQHQPRQLGTAGDVHQEDEPDHREEGARRPRPAAGSAATESVSRRGRPACAGPRRGPSYGSAMILSTRRFPIAVGAALGVGARLSPLAGPVLSLRGGRHSALRGPGEEPRRARGVRARDRREARARERAHAGLPRLPGRLARPLRPRLSAGPDRPGGRSTP